MIRYLPITLGVIAIVGLTVVQSLMSDRFVSTNVTAEQRAKLLENVPIEFGEWVKDKDLETSNEVRDTAGAVGCVNRTYRNSRTGEIAKLWLIVGHARDISAHTPDICFPSSGFSMRSPTSSHYPFVNAGKSLNADFWTNTFTKEDMSGRQLERVFWAWYNPKTGDPIAWQAVSNPKFVFGNSRSLFKMYFSSTMRAPDESAEDSTAAKFGKDFLPEINKILAQSDIKTAPAEDTKEAAAETAPAEASK